MKEPTMNPPRTALVLATAAVAVAALAPLAAADAVYHSEHLDLVPVGNAPLRSGFVQNIKAEGPTIYAHEVFVLNGAVPSATYTVRRNFFFQNPACGDDADFQSPVAQLTTNAAGNATGDLIVIPAAIPAFLVGKHGVLWTVTDPSGAVVYYQTACTAVTLD
jgi:hypothetical protein